jgi:hypothetical protein
MKTRRARSIRNATACALAVAGWSLAADPARAEASLRLSVDWGKLESVLREGPDAFLPHESWTAAPERAQDSSAAGAAAEQKWFGLSPHLSLVARDWAGAQLLLGHLALTDQLRLSRSSRMVVTRIRLADGRFAPFAHVGVGQWRVDTDLMPVLPRDVELATQVGGGFELAISRRAALALEADHTILIREQHEPQRIATPYVWGIFLAARAVF